MPVCSRSSGCLSKFGFDKSCPKVSLGLFPVIQHWLLRAESLTDGDDCKHGRRPFLQGAQRIRMVHSNPTVPRVFPRALILTQRNARRQAHHRPCSGICSGTRNSRRPAAPRQMHVQMHIWQLTSCCLIRPGSKRSRQGSRTSSHRRANGQIDGAWGGEQPQHDCSDGCATCPRRTAP